MSFKNINIPQEKILAAKRGDGEALEQVLKVFEPLAYYTALTILRDDSRAQDAAQEALLRIAKGIPRFEMRSKISTWAYRIIRNVIIDSQRKFKGIYTESLTPENAGASASETEREVETRERWALLSEALEGLSSDKREIVVLFDLQGFSFREISEMIGIPEGTVKSKWARGKNQLRKYFSAKKGFGTEPSSGAPRQKG